MEGDVVNSDIDEADFQAFSNLRRQTRACKSHLLESVSNVVSSLCTTAGMLC